MSIPQVPVVNAGLKYINGLSVVRNDNQLLTIFPGACRDSLNLNDIVVNVDLPNNVAIQGAGGLDQGVFAVSKVYAVYVIADSRGYSQPASLLSLDFAQPALPLGYDMFRRVASVVTFPGAPSTIPWWKNGEGQSRMSWFDDGVIISNGGDSITFAVLSLTNAMPKIETDVTFDLEFVASTSGSHVEFLPFGSSATDGIVRVGPGVAGTSYMSVTMPCRFDGSGVPAIQYKVVGGGNIILKLTAYVDLLT